MHGYAKITKSERLFVGNTGIEAIGRVTRRTRGMNSDTTPAHDDESIISSIIEIDDTDDEKEGTKGAVSSMYMHYYFISNMIHAPYVIPNMNHHLLI